MNRASKVIKYIEKIVSKTIRDVSDIEELINEDLNVNIEKLKSNKNNEDKYIDYMSALNFDSETISNIYIYQLYKNINKVPYSFERFFIIRIYVLFWIILIVLIGKKVF
ncbi:hypothetical protein [Proteus vulgaris]|uniref:hypothetical protein n=1 Tax=Proteus vulgaris TaxID=585 RepID=UPI00235FBDB3|nr:hypothetical protein [Proteus vulgaris]